MTKINIKTAYSPSEDIGVNFEGEKSLTVQSEKDNCDINILMARYEKSGVLPIMQKPAIYADVSELPSFQEALHVVITAQNSFNSLDAKIRDRFNNDPQKFVEFMQDEANTEEAIRLGLANKPEEVEIAPKTPAEAA